MALLRHFADPDPALSIQPPAIQRALPIGNLDRPLLAGCPRSLRKGAIVYGAFQDMRGRPFSLGAALSRCLARIWPILGTSLLVSLIAGVGTLLLIVPGFIALLMLYVAVPACVVEGLGPAASLGRSAELTKGFRWKILGLILLVSLISIICSLLVTFILTLFTGAFVATLGKFAVQALTAALSGVLAAVIYYSLRAAKEGIDIDRIVSVFD